MLPISFSDNDATGAAWDIVNGKLTIATPPSAQVGDRLVLIVGFRSATATLNTLDGDASFAGWTLVQTITMGANRCYLLTRVVDDTDIGAHVGTFSPVFAFGQAGMLSLRGVQDIPAIGAGVDVSFSNTWPCPAQAISRIPDSYLGIVVSDVVAATMPGIYELHYIDGTVGIQLALSSGPIGSTSLTGTTGTVRSGFAASFLLVGDALLDASRDRLSLAIDHPGAIGLPVEGV